MSRSGYAELLGGHSHRRWWDAVIITASSERQASRYRDEIERRLRNGKLPAGAHYLVVPDPGDRRIGSGAATLHAIAELGHRWTPKWFRNWRVLLLHCGGDSRRLPQYSLSGKLFTALPARTPWGDVSTVFDETMLLSLAWVRDMPPGLLVGSGDVVLTFDPACLDWSQPGVTGVALRQPLEVALQHGVYISDSEGRVYSFLQKPSEAQVVAAGGVLDGGDAALDSGLLYFDAAVCERLPAISGVADDVSIPPIDLYDHFTRALTGQWTPDSDSHPLMTALHGALAGTPFWRRLGDGGFTHVGTTRSFHHIHTNTERPDGLMDSFVPAAQLGPGALVIESHHEAGLRVGRGSIVHGLAGLDAPIEVPEDVVLHQVPVLLPDRQKAFTVRAYGVEDDPKVAVASGRALWFGHDLLETLRSLQIPVDEVWPDRVPISDRSLWNARLFVAADLEAAWRAAQWLLRYPVDWDAERWASAERLSLESSTRLADNQALNAERDRRYHARWQASTLALARDGADIRPLLISAPALHVLAGAARKLEADAQTLRLEQPTEAASRCFQAGLLFEHAGLEEQARRSRHDAFGFVRSAVDRAAFDTYAVDPGRTNWNAAEVSVSAAPRIDFGGGWSDTPPFCLDWGGTVLNAALELNGAYPIRATVTRIAEPIIRITSEETGECAECTDAATIVGQRSPGDPLAIPCTALRLMGLFNDGDLRRRLESFGGGLDIRMTVDLPLGSGLGTSSILAAAVVKALWEIAGHPLDAQAISALVLRVEQLMTTGGGWQDQAGGIYPGIKLITSAPAIHQRLRVQPVAAPKDWSDRLVIYYTGIRRVARNLLAQVVGSYLARETSTVQVLHSIKTLAVEMAYAMQESDWAHLGALMDRHWELNKVLDPNTTNAPINEMLAEVRPYVYGAKLAGAGGGGFLMMATRSAEAAAELRAQLDASKVYRHAVAMDGLRVEVR
ncbi:MAG: hypothetical protein IT168_21830 [Bryobacterales bacterium]|nr:hypothetical protein [Bryobacterales bacterium]